jgi:hypothetical protein
MFHTNVLKCPHLLISHLNVTDHSSVEHSCVHASSVPGSVHAASVPAASVPGTGVHAASVHTTYICFHEPTCCVQPVSHVCSASILYGIFKRFTGCVQQVPILDVFARYLHI